MGELKPGWKRVKLGDVVEVVTDYWDRNPDVAERFVAGEHIDEGVLHVSRWGMTSDDLVPPTFNRRFKAGDVLFHSRNLNKLARPDFDGITGEKLFVLRSKDPRTLLPALLPYLLKTRAFDEYVHRMWAGSTNKFLNKAPLVRYEFALPPIEKQRLAVAPLSASTEYLSATQQLARVAEVAERAEIQWWFRERAGWSSAPMQAVGQVQLGQQKHPKYEAGVAPRPYLRVPNINDGYLLLDEVAMMDFVGKDFVKHRLVPGDVLITEGDLIGPRTVGRSAMFRGEIADCCVQKTILRLRPGTQLVPEYALWACRHLRYDGVFAKASTGTTVAHLTSEKFKAVLMPLAPASIQRDVASAVKRWFDTRVRIHNQIQGVEKLHRSLLQAPWSA